MLTQDDIRDELRSVSEGDALAVDLKKFALSASENLVCTMYYDANHIDIRGDAMEVFVNGSETPAGGVAYTGDSGQKSATLQLGPFLHRGQNVITVRAAVYKLLGNKYTQARVVLQRDGQTIVDEFKQKPESTGGELWTPSWFVIV